MIIIWGQRNCGKVDKVPGLFYVVTQFFHLYYIPLIPLKSYVVLQGSEDGNGFKGVQTPMSFKSILLAWLRAALVLAVLGGVIAGIVMTVEHMESKGEDLTKVIAPWVLVVVSVVLYWLTYKISLASRDRALHLAEQLGLPPELVEKFLDPRFQEEMRQGQAQLEPNPGPTRQE
jgi:hypothetical protein